MSELHPLQRARRALALGMMGYAITGPTVPGAIAAPVPGTAENRAQADESLTSLYTTFNGGIIGGDQRGNAIVGRVSTASLSLQSFSGDTAGVRLYVSALPDPSALNIETVRFTDGTLMPCVPEVSGGLSCEVGTLLDGVMRDATVEFRTTKKAEQVGLQSKLTSDSGPIDDAVLTFNSVDPGSISQGGGKKVENPVAGQPKNRPPVFLFSPFRFGARGKAGVCAPMKFEIYSSLPTNVRNFRIIRSYQPNGGSKPEQLKPFKRKVLRPSATGQQSKPSAIMPIIVCGEDKSPRIRLVITGRGMKKQVERFVMNKNLAWQRVVAKKPATAPSSKG